MLNSPNRASANGYTWGDENERRVADAGLLRANELQLRCQNRSIGCKRAWLAARSLSSHGRDRLRTLNQHEKADWFLFLMLLKNEDKKSALVSAAESGHTELVHVFLGLSVWTLDSYSEKPLPPRSFVVWLSRYYPKVGLQDLLRGMSHLSQPVQNILLVRKYSLADIASICRYYVPEYASICRTSKTRSCTKPPPVAKTSGPQALPFASLLESPSTKDRKSKDSRSEVPCASWSMLWRIGIIPAMVAARSRIQKLGS